MLQAVKLGVSRKQGDTTWAATYIFPVVVRTSKNMSLRLLVCVHAAFIDLAGSPCLHETDMTRWVMVMVQMGGEFKHKDFKVKPCKGTLLRGLLPKLQHESAESEFLAHACQM